MTAKPKLTPGPLRVTSCAPEGETRDQFRIENASSFSNTDGSQSWNDFYVNFSGYFGSYGPDLFAAAPELLAALQDVLTTRNAEAKAAMAYTVAHENFGDAGRERVAHERAMLAASKAEANARAVIAKATGGAA
jgi:hypothetical protein